MTLHLTGVRYQTMRAVANGRIAWWPLPKGAEGFVRRVHDGGQFEVFPTTPPALAQLIALCALLDDELIEIVNPAATTTAAAADITATTERPRPRPVRLTDRGRALLATTSPRSQP